MTVETSTHNWGYKAPEPIYLDPAIENIDGVNGLGLLRMIRAQLCSHEGDKTAMIEGYQITKLPSDPNPSLRQILLGSVHQGIKFLNIFDGQPEPIRTSALILRFASQVSTDPWTRLPILMSKGIGLALNPDWKEVDIYTTTQYSWQNLSDLARKNPNSNLTGLSLYEQLVIARQQSQLIVDNRFNYRYPKQVVYRPILESEKDWIFMREGEGVAQIIDR